MMVPLFHDVGRDRTKVLVFIGWRSRPVEVAFAAPPKVVSIARPDGAPAGPKDAEVELEETFAHVVYPVTAEVYVRKVLSREEMRALCDAKKTREAILESLSR